MLPELLSARVVRALIVVLVLVAVATLWHLSQYWGARSIVGGATTTVTVAAVTHTVTRTVGFRVPYGINMTIPVGEGVAASVARVRQGKCAAWRGSYYCVGEYFALIVVDAILRSSCEGTKAVMVRGGLLMLNDGRVLEPRSTDNLMRAEELPKGLINGTLTIEAPVGATPTLLTLHSCSSRKVELLFVVEEGAQAEALILTLTISGIPKSVAVALN